MNKKLRFWTANEKLDAVEQAAEFAFLMDMVEAEEKDSELEDGFDEADDGF